MKKLLIITAIYILIGHQSFGNHLPEDTATTQTDTIFNGIYVVSMTPVYYSISDTAKAAYIGAYIDFDNLVSYANVRYFLFDSSGNTLFDKYLKVEGSQYDNLDKSKEGIISYIKTLLGL